MQRVTIAPGHWLAPAAAASYARARAAGAPAGVTDARLTEAEQADLWRRQGHLGLASRPNSPQALHQQGIALDLPNPARSWFVTHGAAHGWSRPFPSKEPWHFVYSLVLDRHLTAAPPAPAPAPTPQAVEVLLMRLIRVVQTGEIILVGPTLYQRVPSMERAHALRRLYGPWVDVENVDAARVRDQVLDNIHAHAANLKGQGL